jgi:NhaP-type Na+/H+ or K+/H+ antiporter
MSFSGWVAVTGALMLAMALSFAWIRRLPVSTAAIYFAVGCLLGPWGFELLDIDLVRSAGWLERLAEIAVVLALFIGGLRLRLPLRHSAWGAAYRLASLVMCGSIAGVAILVALAFAWPPALALLLASILAPTDPVLSSSVTVDHADDKDRLRYALSGEAGLNDGAAFPFVALGLLLLTSRLDVGLLAEWALSRVLWAVPAALALGYLMGRVVGHLAIVLRARSRDTAAPTDFLALALMALSYSTANAVGAYGFLAVFAAGLGLRRAEVRTVTTDPHPDANLEAKSVHPPAETLVAPNTVTEDEIEQPAVAAGVLVAEALSFGDTLERMLEVLLVVIVGVSLANHWDWRALLVGGLLTAVIRPLVSMLMLAGSCTTPLQRLLIGWFGIRGIGSLYYLAYSCTHGVQEAEARSLADLTLSVVALSIVVHGLTAQPLMEWYERRLERSVQRSA